MLEAYLEAKTQNSSKLQPSMHNCAANFILVMTISLIPNFAAFGTQVSCHCFDRTSVCCCL